MENNLKSAAEMAMKDPKYLPWLHELTTLGYDHNIIVSSEHGEAIGAYFLRGHTPAEAIEDYKDFIKRWKALKDAGEL